jgi:signal transduction histidine kinase
VGLHTIETSPTLSAARAHAGKFRRVAAQALDEVRRLAIGLRPSALDDLGLAAALERYVVEYTQAYGITVDLHAPGLEQGRLPAPVEITLYRILQEALTNIAKHARANLVSVVVERQDGAVRAIIEDDGCGFDVDATLQMSRATKHLGLHSMRERAHLVNGAIAIESTPGRGTTIYVTIPLEETRHGQDQGPDR